MTIALFPKHKRMILSSSKQSKSLIWGKGTFKERRKSVSLNLDTAIYIIPVNHVIASKVPRLSACGYA